MHYDCIIIGCGLSGLSAGLTCVSHGLHTLILSGGMNALHFSSGSLDVFGFDRDRKTITAPFEYIQEFTRDNKNHPYSKMPVRDIYDAIHFFKNETEQENIRLFSNKDNNHFHVTGIGSLKPTYFSQRSVYNEKLQEAYNNREPITILNFEGFRDYYSEITIEQMKKTRQWENYPISHNKIQLPYYSKTFKNLTEFRSIDLARLFENKKYLPRIAGEIKKAAGDAKIVSLPAFLGINNFSSVHKQLEEQTGLLVYEVPTLPPSILGMRIDRNLKNRFISQGGIISSGVTVTNSEIIDGTVQKIITGEGPAETMTAGAYILSTGSFFSNGLRSEYNRIFEPVFDLKIEADSDRKKWYSSGFFDKASHPFLGYGVKTGETLNPYTQDNVLIKNLYCCGSVLSRYNPVAEGNGSGVAIATGYHAARQIIQNAGTKGT